MDRVTHLPDLEQLFLALPDDIQRDLDTLTVKQKNFAILVAHGIPKAQAYRHAYSPREDSLPTSLEANANRTARHKRIAPLIQRMQERALSAGALPEEVPLTREWILKRLGEEAADRKNGGSVRVRALELIGKSQGMFEDVQVVKDERPQTAAEAEAQILKILGELASGTRTLPDRLTGHALPAGEVVNDSQLDSPDSD